MNTERQSKIPFFSFPIFLLCFALQACNNLPISEQAPELSNQQLLKGSPLLESIVFSESDDLDILEITPAMRSFINQNFSNTNNDYVALTRLLKALLNEQLLGIQYTNATRTANGTFETRNGNCLSYTNLFVSLARELGLKVRYQEVDIPPSWDNSSSMLILVRHINAEVTLHGNIRRAVDFNIGNFKTQYPRRIVSDDRAKAHFYSNLAVEEILQENYTQALISIIRGVQSDPQFSTLWTNLGSLYMRNGMLNYAHAAYIQALRIDSNDHVALSNLEKISRRLNRIDIAAEYEKRIKYHRNRNPYYHFYLADQAYRAKDFHNSIRHLNRAIGIKRDDDRFYFLMSLNHLNLGNQQQGKQFMLTAKTVADEHQSGIYQNKIERLFATNQ